MKTKLRKTLSELCKDMGLTDKALDELSELGAQGLAENASDEDIKKAADSLVPYAKLMQGEITRKTSKRNQPSKSKKKDDDDEGDDDDDEKGIAAIVAKQLAPLTETVNSLKAENEALKAEKAKGERNSLIAAEAKKLGIPDYLVKRIAIADDADVANELAAFKQDLVNNNLMPKGAASEPGKETEQMKADAKSWAESLPNK